MALLIATIALSLLGAMVEGSTDDESRQTGPEVAEPPAEHEAAGFYGVGPQTILHRKDYARMGAGGVEVLRVPLSWDNVQQVPGRCDPEPQVATCQWAEFDAVIGQAAAQGIQVLPVFGGRPEFVKDKNSDKFIREHPPISGEGLEAWRDFVGSAAKRYGRDGIYWDDFTKFTELPAMPIEEWQVWNEPNAAPYWPPKPNAREYGKLVTETATAVREADPEAEIVLGGMFGTATVTSRDYLRSLYEIDGIEEYFDSIAIHPYAPDVRDIKVQARWVRNVAEQAGDSEVGLWLTEVGAGSGNGGHPLELGDKGQAKLLKRSFNYFLSVRDAWNVEGIIWFTWKDRADGTVCRFCAHAGLIDARGAPKASWDAFKSFAEAEQ